MSGSEWTAERVLAELTPGMRMRSLFDTAKAATWIAPDELEKLFAEPSYEPGWLRSASSISRLVSVSETPSYETPICAITTESTIGGWLTGLHPASSAHR